MSIIKSISTGAYPGRTGGPTLRSRIFRLVLGWMMTARSRSDLADLTDEQLKDIGLTRRQVRLEIEKPFWQGPGLG